MSAARKPTVLTMLAGGGFLLETSWLLSDLQGDAQFLYLKTEFGGTPGEEGVPPGDAHLVASFATKTQGSVARSGKAFWDTFRTTRDLVRRHSVDVLLAVGSSHAVPMFMAGRLLGKRTIFVESLARVDRLSATGKLVYHLRLASLFVVQWPDLQKSYRSTRLGTTL